MKNLSDLSGLETNQFVQSDSKNFMEQSGLNLNLDMAYKIVNLGTDEAIKWFAEVLNKIDYAKFIGYFNEKNVIGKNVILLLFNSKKTELIESLLLQVKNSSFIQFVFSDSSIPSGLKEVLFRRGLDLKINFIGFLDLATLNNLTFKTVIDELLKRKLDIYHYKLIEFLLNMNRTAIRNEIKQANEDKNIEKYKFLSSLEEKQIIEALVTISAYDSNGVNRSNWNQLICTLIGINFSPENVIRRYTQVLGEIKNISKPNRLVSVLSQLAAVERSMDVKEASIEILGSVLMKASSVDEVMGIVNQLEHPNNYESLRFLQDRQSTLRMGSYGYTCNGREVTTSWIKIMRIAQECILKLAKKNQNLPHDPKVAEFLGKCTSRLPIGIFTSMAQQYEKLCLSVVDLKKADPVAVNPKKDSNSTQSLKPTFVGAQIKGPQFGFFEPHFRDHCYNEKNPSQEESLNMEL